jgi:hypothetical protein
MGCSLEILKLLCVSTRIEEISKNIVNERHISQVKERNYKGRRRKLK